MRAASRVGSPIIIHRSNSSDVGCGKFAITEKVKGVVTIAIAIDQYGVLTLLIFIDIEKAKSYTTRYSIK